MDRQVKDRRNGDGTSPGEVSETAEDQVRKGQADPMPPEGTDETVLHGDDAHNPLRESDRVKATRAVVNSGKT